MRFFLLLLLLIGTAIGANAQCTAPTGLTTVNIASTTATARWQAVSGAINYDVEIRQAGATDWIPYLHGATGLQCIFSSNILPSTTYEWQVRTNCSSGSSVYVQSQFTTGAVGSCVPPTVLFSSNISSTIATVNWGAVSGALSYSVMYKPASSGTWIYASGGTYDTYVTIYSLTPGVTYDWRVQTNCSLYEASAFSVTSQFTTSGTPPPPPPPACPGIYDVSTNGTISGAATIALNLDVKGTLSPKYDNDHYKFIISSGGTITVSLSTLPANYELAVLNSSGTQIGVSKNKSTKSETISLNVAAGTYYAKVYPNGTANNATSCYTLRVQTGTASRSMAAVIEENVNTEFAVRLFPNPAGDQLNVTVQGVERKPVIKIYNMMGKLVMEQGAGNMVTQLNVSRLPAGIYLINVNDGTKVLSEKFVKQ